MKECFAYLDTCLFLDPDDAGVLNDYAFYLGESNLRMDEALAMAQQAVAIEPDNANYLDTYAWLLHLMGRDKEALPLMQKAARLAKDDETIQQHLKEIQP